MQPAKLHRNALKLFQGTSDVSLNTTGENQARNLGKHLSNQGFVFDDVFSSNMRRAKENFSVQGPETAENIISYQPHPSRPKDKDEDSHAKLSLSIHLDPRLRERGVGSLEGKPVVSGWTFPDDGESEESATSRLHEAFLDILSKQPSYSQGEEKTRTVLVVTHGLCFQILKNLLQSHDISESLMRTGGISNTAVSDDQHFSGHQQQYRLVKGMTIDSGVNLNKLSKNCNYAVVDFEDVSVDSREVEPGRKGEWKGIIRAWGEEVPESSEI